MVIWILLGNQIRSSRYAAATALAVVVLILATPTKRDKKKELEKG